MRDDDVIRTKVAELRGQQRAIQAASATRADGWRKKVVDGRKQVGRMLGELSELVAARGRSSEVDPLRRAISALRAALAEHQALWPAVSMDPTDPSYVASVTRVREGYRVLEQTIVELDRPHRATT